MSYRIVILPDARQDIREAVLWYKEKQNNLGRKFTEQIRKKIDFIKEHPNASPIRYDNVRTGLIAKFPFLIHYIVDNQNKIVIISAVFHTSINPEIWKKR